MRGLILAAAVVFLANAAGAADQPVYAPPPTWAKPLEITKIVGGGRYRSDADIE